MVWPLVFKDTFRGFFISHSRRKKLWSRRIYSGSHLSHPTERERHREREREFLRNLRDKYQINVGLRFFVAILVCLAETTLCHEHVWAWLAVIGTSMDQVCAIIKGVI
jgi:hypothetical protein